MKLTIKQLRRIIRETLDPMDPNTPDIIYLSEDDGMYDYMRDRADSAYRRGVRRFGDFWNENWPDVFLSTATDLGPNTIFDEADAKRTMKAIWKKTKEDHRPRSRYDRWSPWD